MPIDNAGDIFGQDFRDEHNQAVRSAAEFRALREAIERMLRYRANPESASSRTWATMTASVQTTPNIYRYTGRISKWDATLHKRVVDGTTDLTIYNDLEAINTATLVQGWIAVGGTTGVTMKPIANGLSFEVVLVAPDEYAMVAPNLFVRVCP